MKDKAEETPPTDETEKSESLEEKLSEKNQYGWEIFSAEQKKDVRKFAENYFEFLKVARTERERTRYAIKRAEANGFKRVEIGQEISPLSLGEKIFYVNRNKNIALIVVGKHPLTERTNVVSAHMDTPRIDLKIRPLYEDSKSGTVLFKTHYYGGLKKYSWVTIPLHLTGIIAKKDGTVVEVEIGLDPKDPVFAIPDILIHLSRTIQSKRTTKDVIKAQEMNVLVGALPYERIQDESSNPTNGLNPTDQNVPNVEKKKKENIKNKFKTNILNILFEKYGIIEADFQSAELSLVSGLPPRYIGLDKSMIGAAGQDDGVCTYAAIESILGLGEIPLNTAIVALFDKEETGSNGNTGAQSAWIRFVMNDLNVRTGINETLTNLSLTLSNTFMLSADVGAPINPNFASVHDPKTAAVLGKGIIIEKYTGHGGKYGSSDALAEIMAYLRKLFEDAKIPYQISTLGDVDKGGGGTIAKFFAESFNCDVVDAGTPILNMHSPYEIVHIADLYATYLAYSTFMKSD
jgi:aspartyl aminopeptidase